MVGELELPPVCLARLGQWTLFTDAGNTKALSVFVNYVEKVLGQGLSDRTLTLHVGHLLQHICWQFAGLCLSLWGHILLED